MSTLTLENIISEALSAPSRAHHSNIEEPHVSYGLFSNRFQIVQAIKSGISYSTFQKLMEELPFTLENWADFLGLSTKSLSRYKTDKTTFKSLQSEKIIELAEVSLAGLEVFDSKEHFTAWLNAPCFALGSSAPIDLLFNSYGKELVLNELKRMDNGIFA